MYFRKMKVVFQQDVMFKLAKMFHDCKGTNLLYTEKNVGKNSNINLRWNWFIQKRQIHAEIKFEC